MDIEVHPPNRGMSGLRSEFVMTVKVGVRYAENGVQPQNKEPFYSFGPLFYWIQRCLLIATAPGPV